MKPRGCGWHLCENDSVLKAKECYCRHKTTITRTLKTLPVYLETYGQVFTLRSHLILNSVFVSLGFRLVCLLFCRHKSALMISDRPTASPFHNFSNNSAGTHSEVKCAHHAGAQSCATAIFHTAGMICRLQRCWLALPGLLKCRAVTWVVADLSPNSGGAHKSQFWEGFTPRRAHSGFEWFFLGRWWETLFTEWASKKRERGAGGTVSLFDLSAG